MSARVALVEADLECARAMEKSLTGAGYQVDKNDDGQVWFPLLRVTNLFGTVQVNDPSATNQSRRLYRVRIEP